MSKLINPYIILRKNKKILSLAILLFLYYFFSNSTSITKVEENSNENEKDNKIFVEISGAIKKPGLYQINEKTRLGDLVELAGGYVQANESCFNLAKKLVDEEKIIIPKSKKKCNDAYLININTATEEILTLLKGIGKTRAEDIVKYRNENGGFSNIDEIQNVSGIGPSTFSKIKEYITVK